MKLTQRLHKCASKSGSHGVSRVAVINSAMRLGTMMLMALVIVAAAFFIGGSARAETDQDKYDFYTLSSNVTAYFSNASEPGKGDKLSDEWGQVAKNPAEGGAFLGYGDNDISGFSGWLISQATGASNTVGYDSLLVRGDDDSSSSTNEIYRGVLSYGQYGSLLNDLGLDSVSTGIGLNLGAGIGGLIVFILFLMAGGIDLLFSLVFGLLDMFNPFRLFFDGVLGAQGQTVANGMVRGDDTPWMLSWLPEGMQTNPFVESMQDWIGGWYQALYNLSWTVLVPLFIAVFVFSSLLWKKGNALSGFKKLAIRLLFIGLGLPLIGSMYTASLAAMTDASGGAGMGATRVIASTYVDFESWAKNNRLAVPNGAVLEWDSTDQAGTGTSKNTVRRTALLINQQSNQGLFGIGNFNMSELGTISNEKTTPDGSIGGESGFIGVKGFTSISDMLLRHIKGTKYTASDFDTSVKGRISQQASGKDGVETNPYDPKACATTWFSVQSDGVAKANEGCSDGTVTADNNPIINVREGSGLQAIREGSVVRFETPSGTYAGDYVISGNVSGLRSANLSALSMYNYLNTTFAPNSATTYSSTNSVSAATREYHNSVNLVGAKGTAVLYWANSVTMLLCFVILGFVYALGMLIGTVKNMLRIITAVPFATLGVVSGIAKVIIYTFAMIVEIIGTLFIYRVVQEIILTVPMIFEGGVEGLFTTVGAHQVNSTVGVNSFNTFLRAQGWFSSFMAVISTLFLIFLTVMLVRFRGVFVKAIQEGTTKLVDKFLDTNIAPPGGGGMMSKMAPALASGVGAGVGMAAGNRMMSGASNALKNARGNKSAPGLSVGASGGPAGGSGGVQSADGGGSLPGGGGGSVSINGTEDSVDTLPSGGGAGAAPGGAGGSGGDGGSPSALPAGSDSGEGVSSNVSIDGSSVQDTTVGGSSNTDMTSATDRDLAAEVEAQGGLSDPVAAASASDSGTGNDPATSSTAGADDAMSQTAGAMEESMQKHMEADQARAGQAVAAGQAVYHGGKAAARGAAGDTAGAAKDATAAAKDVQKANQKGQEAKQKRQEAKSVTSLPAQSQNLQSGGGTQRPPQASRPRQSGPAPATTPAPSGNGAGASGKNSAAPTRNVPAAQPTPQRPAPSTGAGTGGGNNGARPQRPAPSSSGAVPAPTQGRGNSNTGGTGSAGGASAPKTPDVSGGES